MDPDELLAPAPVPHFEDALDWLLVKMFGALFTALLELQHHFVSKQSTPLRAIELFHKVGIDCRYP